MAVFVVADDSEVLASFIIRVMVMDAESTPESSVSFTRLHNPTTQKTDIFILSY
jgi:hypothetical protein